VLAALAGGVLVGFAAWAFGAAQRAGLAGRMIGTAAALASVLAAAALLPGIAAAPSAATEASRSATGDNAAEPWSAARVEALRAAGRPVFVNATAAWCITCQVNDRVALRTEAVQAAFARLGVAYLKADWTRGDPAIGALLRAHGREGVPLYLLYPAAGSGEPAVLPQILTEGVVLRALRDAVPTAADAASVAPSRGS
jgi:thiol:disulfide interchange protein DsbD